MDKNFKSCLHFSKPTTTSYGYITTIKKRCTIHGAYESTVTGNLAPNTTFEDGQFINVVESMCPECKEEEANKKVKESLEKSSWINNYDKSGVPILFKEASFRGYKIYDERQKVAIELCKNWIKGVKRNLIFLGRGGTGKSNLLCASIRNLAYMGKSVKYTTEAEICSDVKSAYSNGNNLTEHGIMAKYANYPFLVIDEYGRSVGTVNNINLINALLIKRYENNKHTAIASNLTPDKLKERLDDAVYRKLTESCETCLAVWDSFKI